MTLTTKRSEKASSFSERGIFLILLLAAGLYCFQLGDNGLWIDEFSSLQDAQTLPESLNPIRPLYYIVLRFWMTFGTGDIWLRGLSVILGLASVFLLHRLAKRVAGIDVANVTAILLACSPLALNHVQEVRMYPLGNVLTLAGSLFLLQALEAPTNFAVGKWVIARVLGVLTIPLSILLLVSDGLIVLWTFRQRLQVLVKFAVGMVCIGLLLVPSAVAMVTTAGPEFVSDWSADLAKPGLMAIFAKLTSFTAFWPLASLPSSLPIKGFYYAYTLLLAVLLAIALGRLKRVTALRWVALWAFCPAALMLVVSYALSPIWNGRYLLFLGPYVLTLLAVGFCKIADKTRRGAIVLTLIYILAVGGGLHQYYANWDRDGWKAAVEEIVAEEKAGDAIAVYAPLNDPRLAVDRYYTGPAKLYPMGPFQGAVSKEEVSRVLTELPTDEPRLWIVFRNINGNREANKLVAQGIEEKYALQEKFRFPGPITVFLVVSR
ncbi:MAG: glycosyltransferase family 39 protein [Cyanobacteria bacterium J06649_4]